MANCTELNCPGNSAGQCDYDECLLNEKMRKMLERKEKNDNDRKSITASNNRVSFSYCK